MCAELESKTRVLQVEMQMQQSAFRVLPIEFYEYTEVCMCPNFTKLLCPAADSIDFFFLMSLALVLSDAF